MNILIISAHPSEKSFNNAIINSIIKGASESGHTCIVRDLYSISFNPVLTAKELSESYAGNCSSDIVLEQQYILDADLCVWVYPLWWGGMPAIMKGYIDRVFSYGFAYTTNNGISIGLLSGKHNFIVQTIGNSEDNYRTNGMTEAIEKIIDDSVFRFCGSKVENFFNIFSVYNINDIQRQEILEQIAKYFKDIR